MRQLINSTYITLDGVVEAPHLWPSLKAGTSGEGDKIQTDLLETCDIVLMGRRTYDVFAPAWMSRSGDPFSDRINTMRKVVVSTTLTDPQWANTQVVAGDVVARVRDLKGEDGGHIVQYGFGDVSRPLLEHGLFDELQLWIHPQLVGPSDAADLVYRPGTAATFELADSQVLSNGSSWRPTGRRPDPPRPRRHGAAHLRSVAGGRRALAVRDSVRAGRISRRSWSSRSGRAPRPCRRAPRPRRPLPARS